MHVLCEVEGVSYAVLVAGLPLDRTKIVPPKNTDVFVLLTRRWGKVAIDGVFLQHLPVSGVLFVG